MRAGSGGAPAEKAGSPAGPPIPGPPPASHTSLQPCVSQLDCACQLPLGTAAIQAQWWLALFMLCICLLSNYLPSYPCCHTEPQPVISFAFKTQEGYMRSLLLGVWGQVGRRQGPW